ncbi:hypothetical protein NQZ68_004687 [Dissostichus eleginoides]|nr:hypothetical protein NQZ68_004687 [Dissostichus eleginoides]
MPVTLSGNARSQPEHPQSTEPTELSGTELGLNREARSPWTCMRKKGQCLSSIDTSMVRRVGPNLQDQDVVEKQCCRISKTLPTPDQGFKRKAFQSLYSTMLQTGSMIE